MSDRWLSIAAVALADHEIHLFYELGGVALAGPALTLGALAAAGRDCLPADQLEALGGRYADQKIWQETTADVGPDIYDHLADMIAGRRKDLATCWTLTPQAQRLLATADLYEERKAVEQRTEKRLDLALGKRASARLSDRGVPSRPLTLAIDSLQLHVFATGVAIAHVVARLRPAEVSQSLTPLELLEGQAALSRFARLSWQTLSGSGGGEPAAFALGLLVRRMVQGSAAVTEAMERSRTYTFVRFGAPILPATADLLAVHLARHYSMDYDVDAGIGGIARIRAFASVGHVLSLEGAATIVAPTGVSGALPAFLEEFKERTLRRHYVPIALLAHHEYCFLIDRTSRSILRLEEERNTEKTLATLARLRSDSLVFRVCFRFSQVSHITMHNELNRGFREALGLDRMLTEFAVGVTEIEAFLRTVEEHKASRRFYLFSMIGGASLAALAGLTIFREFANVLFQYQGVLDFLQEKLKPAIDSGWILWPPHAEKIGLLGGIIVFLIALWLIGRRRPSPHLEVEGEATMHVLLDQMVAASRKEMPR